MASIANGAFYNAGQGCCAVERIYVHADVAEAFTASFIAAAAAFHRGMGDPMDPATTLGPLAQSTAPHRLARQLAEAVQHGAEILYGESDGVPATGYFAAPTVVGGAALRGAQGALALTREETFGPMVRVRV